MATIEESMIESVEEIASVGQRSRTSSVSKEVSKKGIFYMFLSSLSFVFLFFGSKLMFIHSNVNAFEIIFVRGVFLCLMNILYAKALDVNLLVIPKNLTLIIFFRTLIGTAANILNFVGNQLLPISIVCSLFYLNPIFTSLAGYFILHERLAKIEVVGLLLSFSGVLLIIYSKGTSSWSTDTNILYYFIPIISAVLATTVFIITRYTGQITHFLINPTYFGFTQAVVVTPIWLVWRSYTRDTIIWNTPMIYATIMLCFGGWLGQVFMNRAFQIEKAGRIAAVGYIQIPILFFCDIFYFNLEIGWMVILGSVLIVVISFSVGFLRLLSIID